MSTSSAGPSYQGHPSRRENQSVSSNHSQRSDRGSRSNGNPAVESAVTRLLVSIKQLLEALTLWSTSKMNESQVSDVYVRLGNDFNAAVAAFRSYNIDMSELLSVPEDLRGVLEQCLSEDATAANLDIYLPTVRQIITNLLQGLRAKQSAYRRIVSDRRSRSDGDRESRSSRVSRTDSASSSGALSRTHASRSSAAGSEGSSRGTAVEGHRRVTSSSRRKDIVAPPPVPPPPEDEGYFAGGFVRPRTPAKDEEQAASQRSPETRVNGRSQSRTPTESPAQSSKTLLTNDVDDPNDHTITVPNPPQQTPVPANVTRYSLTDKPMPVVVVDEATPPPSADSISSMAVDRQASTASVSETPPETPPVIDAAQAPVIASSLAALKKSETLERRASKRFSTYNISKMTGTGMRERGGLGRSINRRSMAVDSSNLTPGELNVLTEEDETGPSLQALSRESSKSRSREGSQTRKVSRTPTPVVEEPVPPIPPLPTSEGTPPALPQKEEKFAVFSRPDEPPSPATGLITVFLQLGREVKKVSIERGVSVSSLRMLFVDKFSYSPGQDNFPDIYIRDPSSGVMYELEDVDEVKDRCLLSLNIDPLDQIKQHIDQRMSGLTQELKELRSTVGPSKRMSQLWQPTIVTQPFSETDTPVSRPTDKQFQQVARRLSRLVHANEASKPYINGIVPQMTGSLQPQMTGGSMLSEASGRIVLDLKTQFDEVQNLRRDLGVTRQLYVDFMNQTKESLGSLRSQAQAVRKLSSSSVGGAREYVTAGKASLDSRTQNVLTKVEELQDTVEQLKDDVLKRFISPRSNVVKTLSKDIAEVAAELASLNEYVDTVKPVWKKTWEEELQNIVEEQQFLSHQEEFLGDLLEDHKALSEVFGHIEKVISIRGSGAVKTKGFKPPPPEEGHGGLSTVMLEIRNAAIDPERRLKAIAASQKNREREKANKGDEFEEELKGFVKGKKLKMTGGAEEIERVRQKRNDMALKSMFNGGATPALTPSSSNAELPSPTSPTA